MRRWLTLTLALSLFSITALADETKKPEPKKDAEPAPSALPGSLTPEQEERLDKIIDRFIQFDIGRTADKQALKELDALGVEAIPALIRGLNKSAQNSHSCPVAVIHKKLKTLLRTVDNDRTLRFARDNIGAGVQRSPYQSHLQDLKMTCILQTRKLEEARRLAGLKGDIPGATDPYAPAGFRLKSPGEQGSPGEEKKP